MTSEQKQRIVLFREQGFGYAVIADMLGLTKNQVSSFCRRNALTGQKGSGAKAPDMDCYRNCGKPLTQMPGRKPVKFCSETCRISWWNSHPDQVHKKAIYSFTCACCGKPFTAYGNAHRKYCSHACYITARFGGEQYDR